MSEHYIAFVGTNSVRGSRGIYSVSLDSETLKPTLTATHQVYNTGTLAISGKRNCLYAGSEGMTFKGMADGGVYGYTYGTDGTLTEIGAARSFGQRTCSVAVNSEDTAVYGANFYKGTWVKWDLDAKGAPKPPELVISPPKAPNAFAMALHCIAPIGKNYVGVISLAECALVIYRSSDGSRVTEYVFPGRPFPRYLETNGDMIYALMQDPGDVYVFKNHLDDNGSVELFQTISVSRETIERYGNTTIRMTPDKRLLLAATRGTNTITVFRILSDGRLEIGDIVSLPGETPRDFGISQDGKFVVTCLQRSDEICIHRIDYNRATMADTGYRLHVPSPAAIAVTGRIKG